MSDIPVIDPVAHMLPDPAPQPAAKAARGRPKGSPSRNRSRAAAAAPKRNPAAQGVGGSHRATAQDGRSAAQPNRVMEEGRAPITRMSLEERQVNIFDLPQHLKRPGLDYKWETISVIGQRVERASLRDTYLAGWRDAKARDWPDLVDPEAPPDGPVEQYGQRLMERPLHLSQEAMVETYNKAKNQELDSVRQTANGQARGGGLADVRGVVVRDPSVSIDLAIGSAPIGGHRG